MSFDEDDGRNKDDGRHDCQLFADAGRTADKGDVVARAEGEDETRGGRRQDGLKGTADQPAG